MNERGSIAILTVLLIPLLMALVVLVADVGLSVITKMRMQVVADRAALAAGVSLSETMDEIGQANWEIRRNFKHLEDEYGKGQQKSKKSGMQLAQATKKKIADLRQYMDELAASGYQKACSAALEVVEAEFPWAELRPLSGKTRVISTSDSNSCSSGESLFVFGDNIEADQQVDLTYSYTKGGSGWYDPKDVKTESVVIQQYRNKPDGAGQQVGFALRLESDMPLGLAGRLIESAGGDEVYDLELQASAAAQPVNGSITELAFIETDDIDEMRDQAEAEELDYDATLVPLRYLQDEASGYRGLEYYEYDQGWIEDEDIYLH